MERPYRDTGHRSLAAAYETHADGVYDYCFWLTGDMEIAAASTHNSLVAAYGSPGRLNDVATLRPWLYAVARNECLRAVSARDVRRGGRAARRARSGRRSRQVGFPSRPGRVIAGLNSAEQEIAELSLRHRLTPAEVAAVVGRPMPVVRRKVMRVYTTLVLKCGDRVAERFTAPPPAHIPDSLHTELLDSAAIRSRVTYHAERSKPYRRNGFPVPADQVPLRVRPVPAILAATIVAGMILVGAMGYRPTTQSSDASAPTATPSPSASDATLRIGLPTATSPQDGAGGAPVVPVRRSASPTTSPAPTPPVSATPSARPSAPASACPTPNGTWQYPGGRGPGPGPYPPQPGWPCTYTGPDGQPRR